jgi:hypothetical protein
MLLLLLEARRSKFLSVEIGKLLHRAKATSLHWFAPFLAEGGELQFLLSEVSKLE